MERSIQAILAVAWPGFVRTHAVAGYVRRAVWWMQRCGTGELGWLTLRCPDGHVEEVRGKSCRHRACGRCGYRRRREWIDGWIGRLLPISHFQVVFTIASELHDVWRANRKAMAEMLVRASRDTLIGLLAQPEHLGAVPGMLTALHTWSRAATLHPHTHNLVTAGGLTPAGRWSAIERGFLIEAEILRAVFRTTYLEAVRGAWTRGELKRPAGWDAQTMARMLQRAESKTWNVRIEPPYRHGVGLVLYLARYLCGGPIGKDRLRSFDGTDVTFVVGREATNPTTMRLSAEDFVKRLIEHVPVPGLRMMRAYGIYASAKRRQLEQCRALVAATAEGIAAGAGWSDEERADEPRCAQCGKVLVARAPRAPAGPPPMGGRHARAAPRPVLLEEAA